jgi:uncharacterized membrane protein YfcA
MRRRRYHPDAGIIHHPISIKSFSSTSSPSRNDKEVTLFVIDQIKSFSIGSVAGVLGSLAGMGGGFVMIPMMTAAATKITSQSTRMGFGLGLNQHQAHGTSLFAVGTTGLAGAFGYGIHNIGDEAEDGECTYAVVEEGNERRDDADINATTKIDMSMSLIPLHATTAHQQPQVPQSHQPRNNKGLVELDIALALATTAMVTARLGAIASSSLSEKVLQRALGAFMICVAPLVTGKTYLEEWYGLQQDENDADGIDHDLVNNDKRIDVDHKSKNNNSMQQQIERYLPASLIGMFSGFLSGMFGVGGGSIVVPSLVLTTDMSYHSALGTSLCAMVLPAMVGTYTHSKRGNVNWRVAPMLAMGSAVGAYFGGREIGLNVDEGVLRAGFSCLMLVLGVKTWRKGSR